MRDADFQRRGEAHARVAREQFAVVTGFQSRFRPTPLVYDVRERGTCPSCGGYVRVLVERGAGAIRMEAVDDGHLQACERSIVAVREALLDEAVIGPELYEEHLGPCVGSPDSIAELAVDVRTLVLGLRRDLAFVTEQRDALEARAR